MNIFLRIALYASLLLMAICLIIASYNKGYGDALKWVKEVLGEVLEKEKNEFLRKLP